MPFDPFLLERWQGRWEHHVRFDLSESGVAPLSIREVLEMAGSDPDRLLSRPMGYSMTNGTEELRSRIAALHPGAGPENVLVTVGSAEANFIVAWSLVEPGVPVTMQLPSYMQLHGLCGNLGGDVVTFTQRSGAGWEPDLDEMTAAIRPGTRLVIVTNPNNPTGHALSLRARETLLDRVEEVGAWLLVDEVYRGAEPDEPTTPTLWGTSNRVMVTGGLSKAWGLPGLRIGWLVAPEEMIRSVVLRHDYAVIGPSNVSDAVAVQALDARPLIRERTRRILNRNLPLVEAWLGERTGEYRWARPDAGAICLVEYPFSMDSLAVAEEVRKEAEVLLAVGAHFGTEGSIRLGFGMHRDELEEGLAALGPALDRLAARG